jgi:hypothetical protein
MGYFVGLICPILDKPISGQTEASCWTDDHGNTVIPFFTSGETADQFAATGLPKGTRLQNLPMGVAVNVIIGHIRADTALFTLDPISREQFRALSAEEFLSELFALMLREERPPER